MSLYMFATVLILFLFVCFMTIIVLWDVYIIYKPKEMHMLGAHAQDCLIGEQLGDY